MTATRVFVDDTDPFASIIASDVDVMESGHYLVLDSLLSSNLLDPFVGAHARIRELDPSASPMAVWTLSTPVDGFRHHAIPSARTLGEAMPLTTED